MTDPSELKAKLSKRPFRPFIIELDSGTQIAISQDSEVLLPRKRPALAIAFTEDGRQHEFEASAIVRLVEAT